MALNIGASAPPAPSLRAAAGRPVPGVKRQGDGSVLGKAPSPSSGWQIAAGVH